MRQIIFANGDTMTISDRSNHYNIIFENVTQELRDELFDMNPEVWNSFTIRRTTEVDTKDFPYDNHVLEHIEVRGSEVSVILCELSEADINKQALEILMGGAS